MMIFDTFPCLLCTFIVFVIIGLPTFMCGCNKNISTNCIAYHVVNGNVYDYGIKEHTCSRCIARNKNGGCIAYQYYDCYDSFAYVHYGNHNSTCYIVMNTDDSSKSNAISESHDYYIGEQMELYKSKTTSECFTKSNVESLWYTGIVFLSASGLVLVIMFGLFMWNVHRLIY